VVHAMAAELDAGRYCPIRKVGDYAASSELVVSRARIQTCPFGVDLCTGLGVVRDHEDSHRAGLDPRILSHRFATRSNDLVDISKTT